nr:Root meristem growth factor 6 [Ipomoea batatas]
MSSFVAYLFLCFSLMHACTARPLGMFDDNKENGLLISAKGAKLSIMEDGAVSMAETIEAFKKIDDQEDKGGNEVATFSLQEFLHEKLEIKGSEKRARSTLESPTAPSVEEDVTTTGDNDPVEDAVVMDYAQPHRKPPIHNR